MNRTQSIYLDALRGLAAVAVVFHHYSNHIFNISGDLSNGRLFPNIGQEAVIVFFILSGFIISYVSENGESRFVRFISKRISRFYSVVIPACAILVGLYLLTEHVAPGSYVLHHKGTLNQPLLQVVASLTFTNHNLLFNSSLPGGDPFWSLVCEWWYYVLFSLIFFFGNRIFALILIIGITAFSSSLTLLLFPIWGMGCFVYRAYGSLEVSKKVLQVLFWVSLLASIALWASGLRYSLLNTKVALNREFSHATYFPYFWILGGLVGINIFSSMKILQTASVPAIGPMLEKAVRRLANCSFLLYLVHLPMMLAIKVCLPALNAPYVPALLTVAICLLIGPSIESLRFPLYKVVYSTLTTLAERLKSIGWLRSILGAPLKTAGISSSHGMRK